jgi:hypothetical protein
MRLVMVICTTPLLGLLPLRINLLGAGVVIELARIVVVPEVLDS